MAKKGCEAFIKGFYRDMQCCTQTRDQAVLASHRSW